MIYMVEKTQIEHIKKERVPVSAWETSSFLLGDVIDFWLLLLSFG